MRKTVLSSTILILATVAGLFYIVQAKQSEQQKEQWIAHQLWTVGQVSLVVERSFALLSASLAVSDPGIRAEALATIDQTLQRLEKQPELLGEFYRELTLGLTWLKALCLNPIKSQSLQTVEELKAYRDLVVENQQALEKARLHFENQKNLVIEERSRLDLYLWVFCGFQMILQTCALGLYFWQRQQRQMASLMTRVVHRIPSKV